MAESQKVEAPKDDARVAASSAPQVQGAPTAEHRLYQNVSDRIQVYTIAGEQHTLRPARPEQRDKRGQVIGPALPGETVYAKPSEVVKIPSLREYGTAA